MKQLHILTLALFALSYTHKATGAENGYSVTVSPTNLVVGEEFTANFTVPFFSTTLDDWLGVFALGASNKEWVSWKFAAFRGGDTTFDAPETAGGYEVRYFEVNVFRLSTTLAATSETMAVHEPAEDPTKVTNFPPPNGSIIAFGDSLVFGEGASPGNDFPALLSKAIGKPILNKGAIGDTTDTALLRIEKDVYAEHPRIVIILLGGGDVLKGKSVEQAAQNLRAIIDGIHAHGAVVILVGVQGGFFTDRLRDRFHRLWEETGVAFVPNILRGIIGDPIRLFDTVHPNDRGYKVVAERILPALQRVDAKTRDEIPILTIEKAPADSVALSWREKERPFALFESTNLVTPFTAFVGVPVRTNGVATVTLKTSAREEQFFRLR